MHDICKNDLELSEDYERLKKRIRELETSEARLRQAAEEALHQSEELYTRLVNAIPDLVIRTDLAGTILFANDYDFQKVAGYSKEDIQGQNMLSFMTPEDQLRAMENTVIMMEGRMGPQEYQMVKKNRDLIHFEVNGDVLRHDDGTPFGMVYVCRNIDDRKQAEKEREKHIAALQQALSEVKVLSGLLPICASCKKIRDDKGYWNQIESYIQNHSEAQFSHGLCPECASKIYPKFFQGKK